MKVYLENHHMRKNYLPDDPVSIELRVVNSWSLFFHIWQYICTALTSLTFSTLSSIATRLKN